MAPRGKVEPGHKYPWPGVKGGFIRYDSKGVATYYVQRRYQGKRWHFSLDAHQPDVALAQLREWEADPFAYGAKQEGKRQEPIFFCKALIEEFLAWSERMKKNTPEWVAKQRRFLQEAQADFGEVDLRQLDLARDILPHVERSSRQQRIAVIKCLYAWLREVRHLIQPNEDPTFGRLKVPQSRPEQWKHPKAFSRADFEKMLAHLPDPKYRAAATIQAATGWHITETQRFAKSGSIEALPATVPNPEGDVVLRCPQTKAGEPLRTRVSAKAATAAKNLLAVGRLDYTSYLQAMRKACEAAGLRPDTVQPGSFRHSVATWAVDQGADLQAVATFLNHKSSQTTKRFYATHAVPKKVPTLA
jgi:integrase